MFVKTILLLAPFPALLQLACGLENGEETDISLGLDHRRRKPPSQSALAKIRLQPEKTGSLGRQGISSSLQQRPGINNAKICRKRDECPRTMMCEWPLSGPDVWVCRPPEWYTDRQLACNLRGAPPCPAGNYCLLFEPSVPEYPGKCVSKDLSQTEASKMKREMERCRDLSSLGVYACPRDLWCVPPPSGDKTGFGQCLPHDEIPDKYLEPLHGIDPSVNVPCTGLGSAACPKGSDLYCAPAWPGERKQPDGPNRCLTRRQIDVKWIDQIFKIEKGGAPGCGTSRAGTVRCPEGMNCVSVWLGPPISSEEPHMCVSKNSRPP
jgi:hypothetical protein